MLHLITEQGYLPLENRENFSILYDYEGGQKLSFDMSPYDSYYRHIHENAKLLYLDNRFQIVRINKRKSVVTIEAELDMNEWKRRVHPAFHTENKLFSEVMLSIIPDGWSIDTMGAAKERHTIDLEGCTDYDILMKCKEMYEIVYEYHIHDKKIKVIDPSVVQQRGLYMSEELNLDSVEYKGDSSGQINRLYAYGKKTETKNDDGTTTVSFVSFTTINNGKAYVDCTDVVSDEIVCAYWQDNAYEDAQTLLTAAKAKVKELAYPVQSWSCNLYDLSRINEKYKMLDFKLYDKPVLLLDGQAIVHQIVEYTEYPDNQNLNKIVLSTAFKKITGTIDGIKQSVSGLDTELKKTETSFNEIVRDVKNNTLRIQDTYTKGEVDTKKEAIIQQTENLISESVTSLNEQIETATDGVKKYVLESYDASLNITKGEILSSVEEEYTSKSDTETLVNGVKSQWQQTADGFTMKFKTYSDMLEALDGKVDIHHQEIQKFIRYVNGQIELGQSNSSFTLTISNDRISFKDNGVEVAYISNSTLYITDANVTNSLRVGKFAWIPRSNGNLSLKLLD